MFVCCDTNDTNLCTLGNTVEESFEKLKDLVDSDATLDDVIFFVVENTPLKFTYVLTPVLAPQPKR